MNTSLKSWLSEPRVDNPPRFVWRDWVLIAAVVITLVIEVALRDDINAPVAAIPAVLAMGVALAWRRTHPLKVTVAVLGGVILFDVVFVSAGYGVLDLYAAALLLIVMYSTFRWGSGRDMAVAGALSIPLFVLSNVFDYTGVSDLIGGFIVLLFPVAIALSIRFFLRSREQAREQIRVNERESLARDLHDTVAHHMSAIAVQAQAGKFVAESGSLEGAVNALEIIEEEASRTLTEMRSIVGVLRDDTAMSMVPQHGVADIEAMASNTGEPIITVSIDDQARMVGPAVAAALFRIAQESVTNARKHAVNPTEIAVQITSTSVGVQLAVTDNGGPVTNSSGDGFGLIGMSERATLLGGTLHAGPLSTRGWQVIAVLPTET